MLALGIIAILHLTVGMIAWWYERTNNRKIPQHVVVTQHRNRASVSTEISRREFWEMMMGRATDQRTKSQAMAADLVKRGIPHGKRTTVTNAPPVPRMGDVGSAAYRRLKARTTTDPRGRHAR